MKKLFTALALLIGLISYSQSTGYFRYDSIRFEKVGGNAELILLNGTRNVTGGVLTNLGNGRTGFVTPSSSSTLFARTDARNNTGSAAYFSNATKNFTLDSSHLLKFRADTTTIMGGNTGFKTLLPEYAISIGDDISGNATLHLYAPNSTAAFMLAKSGADVGITGGGKIYLKPNGYGVGGQTILDPSPTGYVRYQYQSGGGSVMANVGIDTLNTLGYQFYIEPVNVGANTTHLNLRGSILTPNIAQITDSTGYDVYMMRRSDGMMKRIPSNLIGGGGGGGGGGVTSVSAGYGMSFTTITGTGAVRADTAVGSSNALIGYPRYLKFKDSVNAIFTPMARTLTAGYGLTGGGDLSANRSFVFDSATVFGQIRTSIFANIADQQIAYSNAGVLAGSGQLKFTGQAMQLASTNTTQATTSSALVGTYNSLTTGTGWYIASTSLSSGKMLDIQVSSTAASSSNQVGVNVLLTGANGTASQTTYAARFSNTHTGTTPVNYSLYTDGGLVGFNTPTTDANHTVVIKGPDNSTNHGLKVTSNNETISATMAWNGFTTSGDMAQVSNTGNINFTTLSSKGVGVNQSSPTSQLDVGPSTTTRAAFRVRSTGSLPTGGNILAGNIDPIGDKIYYGITTGPAYKEFTLNDAALTDTRLVYVTNGRLANSTSYFNGTFLGVGLTNPTATITSAGSFAAKIQTVSTTTTLDNTYFTVLVDASGGAVTINLPSASTSTGMIYNVKKIDSGGNSVTIDPSGAELVDGAATIATSTQYTNFTIQCNGTAWYVL